MNRRTTTIFTAAAIALLLVATLIAALLMRPSPNQAGADPEPSLAASEQPAQPSPSDAAPSSAAASPTVAPSPSADETLQAFAAIYADQSLSDAEWLERLAPLTSPALHASLATSDRTLGAKAGTEILDSNDTHAAIGAGGTIGYRVTIVQAPLDDEGMETTPIIDRIDFTDPPADTPLPLSSTAEQDLNPALMRAAAVVIAQPGGLTDQDREAHIREVFTAPDQALQIPRVTGPETAIRIGNIHDLTLTAEDGQLVAYAVVPYAPDGSQEAQWLTLTITLERGSDGSWLARDAHL